MHSFLAKFASAYAHTQHFEEQIRIWRDEGGYGIVFEPQPNTTEQIIRFKAGVPPDYLPPIIGDCLHSMRSGLDHLAYELSERHSGPLSEEQAKGIEFPIFGTRPMTAVEERKRLGLMDPKAAAFIKKLQPHHRGDGYVDDTLWHLYVLANIDRHRLVHTTAAVFGSLNVGGDNVRITMTTKNIRPDLEDGADLGRVTALPIDPSLPVQMHATPEPQIVFKDGAFSERPVVPTLLGILQYISVSIGRPLMRDFLVETS